MVLPLSGQLPLPLPNKTDQGWEELRLVGSTLVFLFHHCSKPTGYQWKTADVEMEPNAQWWQIY